ncbi:hypothetical protein [Syntrophobacter fumaroxidans]|uniref:Uncharacterized protein n=1 Tax=Syntrophobacter fumaroxidans (strain DSM 10017 / MPOB) TaxID=335543 RepID=A0LP42_SYNFM|nr:hypothetical protein [Syntrophobacter fumaroxidans]ABK19194.1 hypothetical protein Sfum_3524 [Syntrophobacter fumaroxidans MPOB]
MKKFVILVIAVMFAMVSSLAMADQNGEAKAGRLFLYQKCDESLIGTEGYDSYGCPNEGTGPWRIFPDNRRWGRLNYSLWGDKFKFSFAGRGLLPETNYTLIYYPDPWPGDRGNGLVCLGHGRTTPRSGNLNIHGDVELNTSLPAEYDANFNPTEPSGAVGAKIWLVLSDDVECVNGPRMLDWNPTAYLFEYNLITYEHHEKPLKSHKHRNPHVLNGD